jgi:shikimate kinase
VVAGAHKDTRPLLRTDPRPRCAKLYEARVPIYAQADLAVCRSRAMRSRRMAGKVIEALATRPDVLERLMT